MNGSFHGNIAWQRSCHRLPLQRLLWLAPRSETGSGTLLQRWMQFAAFWVCLTSGAAGMAAQSGVSAPAYTNGDTAQRTQLPGSSAGSMKVPTPALPGTTTLIDTFRDLLAMTPARRDEALAAKPEPHRTYLQEKVREFEALSPEARETRLTQLELKFYLPALVNLNADERARKLESIPARLWVPIQDRLRQLDRLRPDIRKEVMEYDTTATYLIRLRPPDSAPPPAAGGAALEGESSDPPSAALRLFGSPPKEQQKIIGTLPEPERKDMEQTLKSFGMLPPAQQKACIDSFERFNRMSKKERAEFLRNAARWKAMSPRERETWKALINILPPASVPAGAPPLPTDTDASHAPAAPPDVPGPSK